MMYANLYRYGASKGYIGGEFSWILEDNLAMRRALDNLGASVHKTYRVYDYPLTSP